MAFINEKWGELEQPSKESPTSKYQHVQACNHDVQTDEMWTLRGWVRAIKLPTKQQCKTIKNQFP